VLVLLAALAGCSQEEPIRVYEAAGTSRPRTLEAPASWRWVSPNDGVSRYAWDAGEGRGRVRITVSAAGGDLLSNINRWRVQQLGLDRLEASELHQHLKPLKIDQYEGYYVEMMSPETPVDEPSDEAEPADPDFPKAPKRKPPVREAIYGAIIPAKGHNWFFKLRGPIAAAERERDNFKTFVESGLRTIALAVHEPTSQESADGK
jgi:hypothetical protein